MLFFPNISSNSWSFFRRFEFRIFRIPFLTLISNLWLFAFHQIVLCQSPCLTSHACFVSGRSLIMLLFEDWVFRFRSLFFLWGWSPILLSKYLETRSLNLYRCMTLLSRHLSWLKCFCYGLPSLSCLRLSSLSINWITVDDDLLLDILEERHNILHLPVFLWILCILFSPALAFSFMTIRSFTPDVMA